MLGLRPGWGWEDAGGRRKRLALHAYSGAFLLIHLFIGAKAGEGMAACVASFGLWHILSVAAVISVIKVGSSPPCPTPMEVPGSS